MASVEGFASDCVETWRSSQGDLAISKPVPGVIVFTYHGHMTADVVPFIEESVDRVVALGVRPDLFIDLEKMKGYDSGYRRAVSSWGSRMYRQFGEVRVLVRSKLIAMGIAVSNLSAGGKMRPTTKRTEFERAIESAILRHSNQEES